MHVNASILPPALSREGWTMTDRLRTPREEIRAAEVAKVATDRMVAPSRQWLKRCCLVACGLLFRGPPAPAGVTVYHDRVAFTAALGGASVFTDAYESYPLGEIPLDGRRGDFLYSFDPTLVQPAVVPDGLGGQLL